MISHLVISGDYVQYTQYEKDTKSLQRTRPFQGRVRLQAPLFGRKRRDNLQRAKRALLRELFASYKAYPCGTFATLTFDEKYATNSLRVARIAVTAFCRRLSNFDKRNFPIITVPERHKNGRLHLHSVLFGRQFGQERQNRTIARLWGKGFVDARDLRDYKQLHYIAKYITKQVGDYEYSMRSYFKTGDIPESITFENENADGFHSVFNKQNVWEYEFDTLFLGKIKRITYEKV